MDEKFDIQLGLLTNGKHVPEEQNGCSKQAEEEKAGREEREELIRVIDVDEALKLVSGFRGWHLMVYLLLGLSVSQTVCFVELSIIFHGWTPNHHCKLEVWELVNETIPLETDSTGVEVYSKCSRFAPNSTSGNDTVKCSKGWVYNTEPVGRSIVSDWDIVCEKNFLVDLSQTLYEAVSLVGEITLAYVVDKVGRRRSLIVSLLLTGAIGAVLAFSTNFVMFTVVRCLVGFITAATFIAGSTALLEMFDSKRRTVAVFAINATWVLTYMNLNVLAYFVRYWRYLQLILAAMSLPWLVFIWILPESVIWQMANGRYDEAEKTIYLMAKRNGIELGQIRLRRTEEEQMTPLSEQQKGVAEVKTSFGDGSNKNGRSVDKTPAGQQLLEPAAQQNTNGPLHVDVIELGVAPEVDWRATTNVQLRDIFRDWILLKHLLVGSLVWFSVCLCYMGLILNTPALGENLYLNFLYGGLAEIPGYIIAFFLVKRLGRRKLMCALLFLSGLCFACIYFIPLNTDATRIVFIVMIMVGKCAISAAFCIIVPYSTELFPTNIRSTGSGITHVIGRVGSIIAPLTVYASKSYHWIPYVAFACVSLLSGLCSLALPETTGKPLPNTIAETHELYRLKAQKSPKS